MAAPLNRDNGGVNRQVVQANRQKPDLAQFQQLQSRGDKVKKFFCMRHVMN
jgi:hypothetical protein